jgi:hypothetical protein
VHAQRAIKRQARRLRRRIEPLSTSPESVPIVVRDVGAELRFPASERELRDVLRRLPGRLDGLNGIELAPPTDRHALEEILPGVLAPRVLGSYRPDQGVVHLHTYVCERELEPFLSAYLRLRALATFVHELAHHYDATFRTGRDRWRMEDRAKSEAYARERAFEDTRTVVLPTLRESDGEALASLSDWIATHAGVELPLELLVDERGSHAHLVDHGFAAGNHTGLRETSHANQNLF